jgi:hypothetical protein
MEPELVLGEISASEGHSLEARKLAGQSIKTTLPNVHSWEAIFNSLTWDHHDNDVHRQQSISAACYFTSARKLGIGSGPMSACFDTVAAAPGVPAATPRIGGTWRVTCAEY